jgi:Cap4 dsDNA endonuclease
MDEVATAAKDAPASWPSIDDVKPDEEGGPIARAGFNYQDEIAVGFLIEMLETRMLLKVHCETHDDVVLVRMADESETRSAEFVQVKASEPDKLWSVADLCQRKNGKAGTSIFEISLGRDRHNETSRFRLVTLRPVVSALELLTYPCGSPGREPDAEKLTALRTDIEKRFPALISVKGNGISYWLANCHWDQRHSEDAVRKDNLVRLMRLSIKEGRPLLLEPAEVLLNELRAWAKSAGAAKWEPDRDSKIILRQTVRTWWDQRMCELTEGAASTSGGKLITKMTAAGLPDELIELAIDMRRGYAAASRTSRYLQPEEGERLQGRVKSEVMSLRARFVAGQLDVDGAEFHSLCLDRMDAVNAERGPSVEDRSAFLKGCMYDIADRCLLRFERPVR